MTRRWPIGGDHYVIYSNVIGEGSVIGARNAGSRVGKIHPKEVPFPRASGKFSNEIGRENT